MPHYRFHALDTHGLLHSGQRLAPDGATCRHEILSAGLTPIQIHRIWFARDTPLSTALLARFCTDLHELLAAGIPLPEALEELAAWLPAARQTLPLKLSVQLRQGRTFSEALHDMSPAFPAMMVTLVQSGERSGQLAQVLQHFAEHLNWQHALRQATLQRLAYPLLSALSILGAAVFLMIYLVPALRTFTAGQALPWASRALFWLADTLSAHGGMLGVGLFVLSLLLWIAMRTHPGFRAALARLRLRLPLIGTWHARTGLAAYTRTLALLYTHGVPILDALQHSEQATRDPALRQMLAQARTSITHGASLRDAFASSGMQAFAPGSFLSLLALGERTGQLGKQLEHCAHHLLTGSRRHSEFLHAILQPAITLGSALLLGWIALAIFGPLYGQIGKGMPS